jgi:hypothetical protein
MRSCPTCHGAIGEPGVAYGYAGKWCECTTTLLNSLKPGQMVGPFDAKGLEDYFRAQRQKFAEEATKPAPFTLADVLSLTPEQFVYWLRGYFASCDPANCTRGDTKTIAAQLTRVVTK